MQGMVSLPPGEAPVAVERCADPGVDRFGCGGVGSFKEVRPAGVLLSKKSTQETGSGYQG